MIFGMKLGRLRAKSVMIGCIRNTSATFKVVWYLPFTVVIMATNNGRRSPEDIRHFSIRSDTVESRYLEVDGTIFLKVQITRSAN